MSPNRKKSIGALKHHARGCRVSGGSGLPPGHCQKCKESVEHQFVAALMRYDRKGNARD